VLPAATHFEHDDIYCAYGQQYVQRASAVIAPVGSALPNTEIFRRLAARFGFNEDLFKATDQQLMDDALDKDDPRLNGYLPSELPVGEAFSMDADRGEVILFENSFPATPSGKIELKSEALEDAFGQVLPNYKALKSDYPLTLITPSSNKMITSTFGGLPANKATPVLEMHPDDAHARDLTDGEEVHIYNELGDVYLPLKITDAVRPGVVYSPKGSWFVTTRNDQTVSALAPSNKADLCHGACYNDCRVEIKTIAV